MTEPPKMDVMESVLEAIGNTPLIRLGRIGKETSADLIAKVESFNPGGSVKDRVGLAMLRAAKREGKLEPGGLVVECTSGNTGMGIAIASAILGYRSLFTMPDKMSLEKINLLKAMGSEVIVTPTAVPADSPESYYSVAAKIVEETPNAFHTNQYHNQANPQAHYETTGPEIWEQTGGRITHFIATLGTGGTISGTGRFLKEKNPKIQVIGVDPDGSILKEYFEKGTMGEARPYKVEGIGEDIIPTATHFQYVDRVVQVTDKECFLMTRRLAREEGLLVGGSCGGAVSGALKALADTGPDAVAVVILPDTGERYLSKVFNDEWMRDNGYLEPASVRIHEILASKGRDVPSLVTLDAERTVRDAIALVRAHDISVIPVLQGETVVGTVNENALMRLVFEDPASQDRAVALIMEAPLPQLTPKDSVQSAIRTLAERTSRAVLVCDENRPVGILSSIDLIGFVSR